jgi:carboxylesterase type B
VAGFPKSLKTESDRKVSKNLTRFFTNMAKHGNPTPEAFKNDVTNNWEPQKRFSKRFLIFGEEIKIGELDFPMRKRIEFWNKIVREGEHSNWIPSNVNISRLYEETADKRSTLFNH